MDRVCRWLLALAGLIGGRAFRRDRLPEWEGELWALRAAGARARLRFAATGVLHAAWLRREEGADMGGWGRDVSLAVRRLGRAPGYAAVTIIVLGLGIGANTALFNALDAALRGSAPYPDPDRLVMVDLTATDRGGQVPDTLPWSWPTFSLARERIPSLEPFAAYSARDLTLTRPGDPDRVEVELVSAGYFDLLGVRPRLGRVFTASEEPPADVAVAVLGHALWTSRFGSDPNVLGRSVTVEGRTLEVVGVLPPGFRGLTGRGELWVPIASAPTLLNPRLLEAASLHWFYAIGRLRPDVPKAPGPAELTAAGAAIDDALGGGGHGVSPVPFLRARVNPITRLSLVAVLVGGLLLLGIACANVASLVLARASVRRTDVAVRAALGASRTRIARELILESLILSLAGGSLGVGLAIAAERGVARWAAYALEMSGTRNLQYLDPAMMGVNGVALAMALTLALGTGLVSALLPLRAVVRPELAGALRGGPRGIVARTGRAGEAGRALLVSAQIALTLVLVAGAGLMAASLSRLSAVEVGFTRDDVLALHFERRAPYSDEERMSFERELIGRLRGLPGVERVAIAPCPPLEGPCEMAALRQLDDTPAGEGRPTPIVTHAVSDDYFATVGVPVLSGRTFDARERSDQPPLAVVNETAARTLFGGNAVGHRIAVTHAPTESATAEIVGIVGDVRDGRIEGAPTPAVYFSRRQTTQWYGTLFLAVRGDPWTLLGAVRREASALDPDLPLFEVTTLGDLRSAATARTRVVLGLLLAFASLGLLLSAVGIYGVVSYEVLRRRREMGLRLALGAPASGLVRSVVGRPALLGGLGAVAGVAGAFALTGQVQGLLFGVEPWDPRVMGGATMLLVGIAVAAAWIPARRALRVDPVETLQGD